jgi:hypothetical protein
VPDERVRRMLGQALARAGATAEAERALDDDSGDDTDED